MSVRCLYCGERAGYGREIAHKSDCVRPPPLTNDERLNNFFDALSRCDRCDKKVEKSWNYCASCGHHLVDDEPLFGAPLVAIDQQPTCQCRKPLGNVKSHCGYCGGVIT